MKLNLHKVFGTEDYLVICDNPVFLKEIQKYENAVLLDDFIQNPECENIFVFIDTWIGFNEVNNLIKKGIVNKVLTIPQVSFEPGEEFLKYSLNLLLHSDFEHAIEQHLEWQDFLSKNNKFAFGDGEYKLVCELCDNFEVATLDSTEIDNKEVRSIAEYFEVCFENSRDEYENFIVNGTIKCSGILFAKSPDFDLKYEEGEVAKKHIEITDMVMVFKNNKLISCKSHGEDISNILKHNSGEKSFKNAYVTEFAIGTNMKILKEMDMSINAQINEGVQGIHVGIGNGTTGFHMDFLCPDYRLVSYES